ncbi:MAG: GMC family oxidoreductase [Chloroflexota bacterium]|nr:GMC family oxidoreductase [Chloroflexota bacterium]
MFVDGRGITDGELLTGDVAVVGSGAAGITLARELSAGGARVLLIESGNVELEAETQQLYEGENIGLPYFPLVSSRLRYFGGTTNHWSGTCRPFDAFDLAPHPWSRNSGWPISIADIDAYYARAGEISGLPSAEWETHTWVEDSAYRPLELDPERVVTRVAQNVRDTHRRFARNYGDELEASAAVTVLMNTNLVEIELGESPDEVVGLRLRTLAGNSLRARARTYVIAAGGIENARLLLASNRRLPAGIGNGHDLVGRYFLEHPRFVGGVFVPFDAQIDLRFYQAHNAAGSRITGYLALPPSVREAEGLQDVQFRLEPRYAPFYERASSSEAVAALRRLAGRDEAQPELPDDISRVADDLTSWRRFLAFGAPLPIPLPDVVGAVAAATPDERGALIPEVFGDIATVGYGQSIGSIPLSAVDVTTRIDPVPNPDSRISLGQERDTLGIPRAQLDWRLSSSDRDSVVRALELLGAELGRAGLGRLRIIVDADGDRWPEDLAGGWHHMGTTRMHGDSQHGVVDRDCRVHGMRNLYIAGSSVFPTAGSATPTMTIVALALRLAAHLQQSVL